MSLPPDRSHVLTELRHDASHAFDELAVADAIALVTDDHHRAIDAVARAEGLAELITDIAQRMRRGGRLVYLGAGTSGRLGVLDAAECPPTFHVPPGRVVGIIAGGDGALRQSSEGLEDDPEGARAALDDLVLTSDDTVIGIAAGGTTPYVLGGLGLARTRGAGTAFLTCSTPDPAPACDRVIVLDTGPELLTGSTRLKAGTATKLALNTITTLVFTRLGKVYGNLMVDLRATNDKLVDRALRILIDFCPDLDRTEAHAVLRAADHRLPVAIVMARCGLDRAAAVARLDACGQSLRGALE